MNLDPAEKAALRDSFAALQPYAEQASVEFYETLFELDPRLRGLFRDDLQGQGMRFMTALGLVVGLLDDPERLQRRLQDLGRAHAAFGLTAQDYQTMSEAFYITLRQTLGPELAPEAGRAWRRAFTMMCEAMLAAGRD